VLYVHRGTISRYSVWLEPRVSPLEWLPDGPWTLLGELARVAPPLRGIREDFLRRYARVQLVVGSNFAPFCTEGFRCRFVLVAFVNSHCSATSRYKFSPKITKNYRSNQFMMNFDRTVFTFLAICFVFRTVNPDHSQPPLARISPPPRPDHPASSVRAALHHVVPVMPVVLYHQSLISPTTVLDSPCQPK